METEAMATTTKTRYTLAEMPEWTGFGWHYYELLGGELVVRSAPDQPHAVAVVSLVLFLGEAQKAGHGRVQTAPRAVALDWAKHGLQSEDVPYPDVLFVRETRRSILQRAVEAAPDLVIEVLSPSTRKDDLPGGRKFAIYERYGVPYYWTVDTEARTITQYTWSDGRYGTPLVLHPGDVLSCPLFPGVECDAIEIFAELL